MFVTVQLLVAIASEVMGTTALRASQGFSRLGPSILVAIGYGLSFFLLSRVLQHLSIAVTYAVWSGVGIAAIAVIGAIFYGEAVTVAKIVSLAFIVAGVIGLQLSGTHR